MELNQLKEIMYNLSKERPVFHSGCDFQHELAIRISDIYKYEIRLEVPINVPKINPSKKFELDILAINKSTGNIGIELKYTTNRSSPIFNNEQFFLKKHSNQGGNRYGFLKDIYRLELLKETGIIAKGFAILLTNNNSMLQKPKSTKGLPNRQDSVSLENGRKIKKNNFIGFVPELPNFPSFTL